jgi:hypothetical protein
MLLVGNKYDLEMEGQVLTSEGAELAKYWGCPFLEASAFSRINVDESFHSLVREIRRALPPESPLRDDKEKKGSLNK